MGFLRVSSAILLTFGGVWWVGLLYTHASLPYHGHQTAEDSEPTLPQRPSHSNPKTTNPYYGWQPEIPSTNGCSIRTCFKEKHDCPACRDLESQMGASPPAPVDWVPDVTMLRRMYVDGRESNGDPWPPPLSEEYCEDIGFGGGNQQDINKQLLDKVPIRGLPSPRELTHSPRLFCGIYTMQSSHARSIRAMRETWAPHCDGFLAFSTASDPRIPALNVTHEGPEEYNNMWQKSRSIWKFIADHYLQDFDYFILGGDDLFVMPTNLRNYLSSLKQSPEDDLFAGRRFKGYGEDNYFNSGGAGYVLSRATLRKYATTGYNHPDCSPHRRTAMEDVMLAACLRKVFGIGLTDTRDAQGRERFHPFAPGTHLTWQPPKPGADKDWYEEYNREWGLKLGVECCAPDSVSFHYMKKPAMVRHLYSLLYTCDASVATS